ncbi:MAG TPA: hypothetical protein PLS94_01155 [Prolixibacteraceae bacterium]|nr:hypothetical protein [Prolixibacteraceae bacterium]
MNKLIFSPLLFLFLAGAFLQTFAQSPLKFGIAMGSTLPLGQFKSYQNIKYDAGFAQQGFTLTFDGDYYLHNRFALTGRFHFGSAPINKNEGYNWTKSVLGEYFNDDSLIFSAGYWQWSAPLVGAKYNYPIIINKFYIEAGVYSGLNISTIPTLYMEIIDTKNKRTIFSQNLSKTNYSVPLKADLALRLEINKQIQFKIQAGYYSTKSHHKHVSYYVNENSTSLNEEINNIDHNIKIEALSFSAGLIYTFTTP